MSPRYSIIPGNAPYDTRLTDFDFRVLGCIGRHTNEHGWCWINQSKLAKALGKSRETVNRAISKLCKPGFDYLEKVNRQSKEFGDKRSNLCLYRVRLDGGKAPETPDEEDELGVIVASQVGGERDATITPSVTAGSRPVCAQGHTTTTPFTTTPNTTKNTAQQAAHGVSFDEFWGSLPSPMKKGKALARKHWAKLSQDQRKAANEALPAYLKTDEPKRGFFKHGSSYLGTKVWEDYEQIPHEQEASADRDQELQVKALALDLRNGVLKFAAKWWDDLSKVPGEYMQAARDLMAAQDQTQAAW